MIYQLIIACSIVAILCELTIWFIGGKFGWNLCAFAMLAIVLANMLLKVAP